MKAIFKLIIAIIILVPLLIVGGVIGVSYVDWTSQKPALTKFISDKSGYKITFDKIEELQLLPKPRVKLIGIKIASFNGEKNLFTASAMEAEFSRSSLLRLKLGIDKFSIANPVVNLERDSEGVANWQTKRVKRRSSKGMALPIQIDSIGDIVLSNGKINYHDAIKEVAYNLEDFQISLGGHNVNSTKFNLRGKLNDIPFKVNSTLGLASLTSVPASGELVVGDDTIEFQGMFIDIFSNPAYNGNIAVAFKDISTTLQDIFKSTILPQNTPLEIKGELRASASQLALSGFKIAVGGNTFSGTIDYILAEGDNGSDFMAHVESPIIDANSFGLCENNNVTKPTNKPRWSEDLIDFTFLKAAKLDVALAVNELKCGVAVLRKAEVRVNSKNGHITVERISTDIEGGGTILLAGTANVDTAIEGNLNLSIRELAVEELLAEEKRRYVSFPLTGKGTFIFTGKSIAELVGGLSGSLDISSENARVELPLENLVLAINNILSKDGVSESIHNVSSFKSKFEIKDGIIKTKLFDLRSDKLKLLGTGKIDLSKWTINYLLTPKATTGGVLGVTIPVTVKGSLDSPSIAPQIASAQNIGAGVGAVIGGPLGAGVGAMLGNILSGEGESEVIAPPKEATTPGLPFDLLDRDNLQDNIRDFLMD